MGGLTVSQSAHAVKMQAVYHPPGVEQALYCAKMSWIYSVLGPFGRKQAQMHNHHRGYMTYRLCSLAAQRV